MATSTSYRPAKAGACRRLRPLQWAPESIGVEQRIRRPAWRRTAMPVELPLARQPTINLNSLHGGQFTRVGLETPCVPDRCRAVFDRRYIAEESFEEVKAEIVELIESANRQGPGRLELR